MDNWQLIYSTEQAYKAEIVRMVLQDNNIDAVVVNKKDSSYSLLSLGEIEVHVRGEDVILARIIIEREQL